MCTCFLYWLEVLSLVKEVCVAMGIIKVVWCKFFVSCVHRFCCCCWVGLLRWLGHDFPPLCKPPCWYHPDSDTSREMVTSGPHKGQCSPTWLNT
jgi:hypothetical protein